MYKIFNLTQNKNYIFIMNTFYRVKQKINDQNQYICNVFAW